MTESTTLGPYTLTRSGRRVYYLRPGSAMISPADLAWHLAHLPRFNGATRVHYSVAQHCVIGQRLAAARGLSKFIQLGVLLHDAPEAYIGDIISPLKVALGPDFMKRWREIETALLVAIYARAGIDWMDKRIDEAYWETIKEIDRELLARERVDLMPADPHWNLEPPPDLPVTNPWTIDVSAAAYSQAWQRLTAAIR